MGFGFQVLLQMFYRILFYRVSKRFLELRASGAKKCCLGLSGFWGEGVIATVAVNNLSAWKGAWVAMLG